MRPTPKKLFTRDSVNEELTAKLLEIEGKNSSNSRTEKTREKNQQATSGSSSSVSAPTTPRLKSGTKSTEKAALAFDGSKVKGDPHTPPLKRAKLERKIQIREEVTHRPKKSIDDDKSSSSTTPRSVRFASSDANTPVSNRSAAPTPTSTPMPTPRTADAKDESSSDSSGRSRPVSPRAKELRKKISKGFSKAAINIGKFGEKLSSQVASISTSNLPTPKSSGRNSPKNSSPQKEDVLSFLTIKEKNDIAIAINQFEAGIDAALSPNRKKMLLHAKLMELLPDRSKLKELSVLDVLMADVKKQYSVALIDKEIDLADPEFIDFVKARINDTFFGMWAKDSTDAGLDFKKYYSVVKPTFARDFGKSTYEIKNSDGSLKKISAIDEFIEFIGHGTEGNLPMVVSNIASQNLSQFIRVILFVRENNEKISQSILHLDDGTPIMPLATARAKYTFSKNSDGKIIVDYEWTSSKEINHGNPLRIKKVTGNQSQSIVEDATLNIKVNIEINPDGRWHINNPHVIAENWNNVVS